MTLARLTRDQLELIDENKTPLIKASAYTGVPWQALAALWFRETGLRLNAPNPFQFDPIPTYDVLMGLLRSFVRVDGQLPAPCLTVALLRGGVNDFASASVFAACWLRHNARFNLFADKSDQAIADALYGYNGRAYGADPFNSPYVANEMDEAHHAMHFRGTISGKWIDIIDERPGAFTVYKQLVEEGF